MSLQLGEFKKFSSVTFNISQSINNIRELFLKFGLIFKMLCSNTIWIFWLFCLKQCIFASQGFLIHTASSFFLRSGADQKPLASEDENNVKSTKILDRWEIYPTLFPPFPLPVCPLWMAPPMYQEHTVCGRIVDDKVVHILKWKVFLKCTCWIETKVQWKKTEIFKECSSKQE